MWNYGGHCARTALLGEKVLSVLVCVDAGVFLVTTFGERTEVAYEEDVNGDSLIYDIYVLHITNHYSINEFWNLSCHLFELNSNTEYNTSHNTHTIYI